MKTVSVVCTYFSSHFQLHEIMVTKSDGFFCSLLCHGREEYDNLSELGEVVLQYLKNNNFKCNYFEDFGGKVYNINFIDLDNRKSNGRYIL